MKQAILTLPTRFKQRTEGDRNRYQPHQGRSERGRRLKQIKAGTLRGSAVSDDARYAAYGLVKA